MREALAKVKADAEREIEETKKASVGGAREQSERAKRREDVGITGTAPHHFPRSFGADGKGKLQAFWSCREIEIIVVIILSGRSFL